MACFPYTSNLLPEQFASRKDMFPKFSKGISITFAIPAELQESGLFHINLGGCDFV